MLVWFWWFTAYLCNVSVCVCCVCYLSFACFMCVGLIAYEFVYLVVNLCLLELPFVVVVFVCWFVNSVVILNWFWLMFDSLCFGVVILCCYFACRLIWFWLVACFGCFKFVLFIDWWMFMLVWLYVGCLTVVCLRLEEWFWFDDCLYILRFVLQY